MRTSAEYDRRAVERIMLRADRMAVQPDKYRKRVREIFRFAADVAQRILDQEGDRGRCDRRGAGHGAA
jgi:hypothetical protein